jgi:hypothetical protein
LLKSYLYDIIRLVKLKRVEINNMADDPIDRDG